MPDFKKDLSSSTPYVEDIKINKEDLLPNIPSSYFNKPEINVGKALDVSAFLFANQDPSPANVIDGSNALSFLEYANADAENASQRGSFVSHAELKANKRYAGWDSTIENFEAKASNAQSGWEQARHGVIKGIGIASTTFINGTVGLVYGIGKGIKDGRLASVFDNPLSQYLDNINKDLEDEFANYKTQREQDGHWYEPANFFTANFFFDNIVKNLGFAAGAYMSGSTWGSLIKATGLTKNLVGLGEKWATEANTVIANAAKLSKAERMAATIDGLEGLTSQAKSIVGAGLRKADQGIVAFTGTYSEAGMEGMQNIHQFRAEALKDFEKTNNRKPNSEELKNINDYADRVGLWSFGINTALLTGTNYIQLSKIYASSFGAEKNIVNGIKRTVIDGAGEYVGSLPTKGFSKLLYKTKNVSSLFFNPTEAFEEGSQFAIQTGTQNYFGKKTKGEKNISALDAGVLYGVKQALTTDEGTLNVFIGGFSGALQSSGIVGVKKNEQGNYRPTIGGTGKIGERGITGYGGEDAVNRAKNLDILNNTQIVDKLKQVYSNVKAGEIIQQERARAIEQGEILESKDLEFDYAHSFIESRLTMGAKEFIDSEIKELKEKAGTEKGFQALKEAGTSSTEDSRESFIKRLDNLQEHANTAENIQKTVKLKYGGVLNENKKPLYNATTISKLVYAGSKIFNYNSRIPELKTELLSNGINIANVLQNIADTNKPTIEATKEALQQINALDTIDDNKYELKTKLSDLIELSLRRNQFIEEYNGISKNPLQYESIPEEEQKPIDIVQEETVDKKKIEVEKKIEVGKEYSLKENLRKENNELHLAPKLKVLSQTLGGEYEVKLPNGKIKFLTKEEFKDYNISEIDNTSEELKDIFNNAIKNVLKDEKYKDVEDSSIEYINSLGNKELIDAIEKEFNKQSKEYQDRIQKEKEDRERLLKNKTQLDKEQKELELKSGTINNNTDTTNIPIEPEGKLVSVDIWFQSGTSESEDYNYGEGYVTSPHVIRSREFLNNINDIPNKDNARAILVTPKQAENIGLNGLTQLAYKVDVNTPLEDIKDALDIEKGLIAQIFVTQEKEKLFYVDKNGNKIKNEDGTFAEVGKPVSLDNIVFQTMRSTDILDSAGKLRFRKEQLEEAELLKKEYIKFREELFTNTDSFPQAYSFSVSRGLPIENTMPLLDAQGNPVEGSEVKERNQVGGILVPENKISTQEKLIIIPTTGTISHNNKLINFPNGVPVLQYGSTLQHLRNRQFNKKEASTIFAVINELAKDVIVKSKLNSPVRLNREYVSYLQNMLYWREGKTETPNQININTEDMSISLGGKSYQMTEIESNKEEIISNLLDNENKAFQAINNTTLNSSLSDKFYEYKLDNGILSQIEWDNYQTYLLSSKYPDGSNRSSEDTPLTTTVSAPTESIPYSFKQKYATLSGGNIEFKIETPIKKETVKEKDVKKETPVTNTKIGEYILDGSPQIFNSAQGEVVFTGTIADKNTFDIKVETNPTVIKISKDEKEYSSIVKVLTALDVLNEEDTPVRNVREFLAIRIKNELKSIQKESPAIEKEIVVETPVEGIIEDANVDTKKANVEKRRQEDFIDSDFNEQGYKAAQKIIGNYKYLAAIDRKGNVMPLSVIDLVNGKELHIAKVEDGAGRTVESSVDFPIEDFKKTFKNAELAKLENKEKEIQTDQNRFLDKNNTSDIAKHKLRKVGKDSKERMTDLELQLFKQWHAENVPNIPYEVLENIIDTLDGEKAWGAFENGVAKFVRGGLKGTEYHEIFHGLFNTFLSKEEQEALLNEFKAKQGTFKERTTGKSIEYSEANNSQIEERLADDFTAFRLGKLPARTLVERILKFFKSILEFAKSFVNKPTLKSELFKAIDAGKFIEYKVNTPIVREGIKEVFNSTPELSKIGTQQQYSQYLDTIFPNSKVKEIVYRGLNPKYETTTLFKEGKNENGEGIYFTTNKEYALRYGDKLTAVILDIKNPKKTEYDSSKLSDKDEVTRMKAIASFQENIGFQKAENNKEFDGIEGRDIKGTNDEIAVFDKFQIYLLGSEKDIKGFKEFIKSDTKYSKADNLTTQQAREFIDDMVARVSGIIFKENDKKTLFIPEKLTEQEIFDKIKTQYSEEFINGFSKLELLGDKAWKELIVLTKEKLRPLKISFNKESTINEESSNKNDYVKETFTQDWKKNSSGPIKFSMATMIERVPMSQEDKLTLELPKPKVSDVQGFKLLPFNRVFATIINKLSNITSTSKMVKEVSKLAEEDANYISNFTRLGGDLNSKDIPFDKFNKYDWRYFVQFKQTFTKQKPEALIQYIEDGEIYIGTANLFTANKLLTDSWIENIKALAEVENSLITKNIKTKTFQVNIEELKKLKIDTPINRIDFLNKIGIAISLDTYTKLKKEQIISFNKAISALKEHLGNKKEVITLSGKTLDVAGQLNTLAELSNKVNNPDQESTYFGVKGQRVGAFADNNALSLFANRFNEANTLEELLKSMPFLNDVFSKNSQVLKKGGQFFNKEGDRIKELKVSYIQGIKDKISNKGIAIDELTKGQRFTLEINQNIKDNFYALMSADGATEWMMNLGTHIPFKLLEQEGTKGWNQIYSIFQNYLTDDISLALEDREHLENMNGKGKELRFFKDILSSNLITEINKLIEESPSETVIQEFINNNLVEINSSIKEYLKEITKETRKILEDNNEIGINENTFSYNSLLSEFAKDEKFDKANMSSELIDDVLLFSTVNYQINNIEYHKLIFGDPCQFKIKKDGSLDQTKRIKPSLSPRRTTVDTPEFNTFLNQEYNKVGEIQLSPNDIGYHKFKEYTDTVVVKDIDIVGSLSDIDSSYAKTNEADGFSWLKDDTHREIGLKNGEWSDEAEDFHQWQMAWTRQNHPNYTYTNTELEKQDKALISKPTPKYELAIRKPIVSGVEYGSTTNYSIIDKYAQMPLYYSMAKDRGLETLYNQMQKDNIGYVIVESGRKEGITKLHDLYNNDGTINETPFNNNTKIGWDIYGIQAETATEGEHTQTMGTQTNKVVTLDLFDNGEAIGVTPERKEYIKSLTIKAKKDLENILDNGYNTLLKKLGVEDTGEGFIRQNGKAVSELLMQEMLRREVSQNTKDSLQLDGDEQFKVLFEATPSYIQIRNIMYSLVDKAVRQPKMTGGPYIQAPSTMFEAATKGRGLAIKNKEGKWEKISKEKYNSLTEEEKKHVMLTDSSLKFYTKEDPYCGIYISRAYLGNLGKHSNKTDKELLEFLQTTPEGKSILQGIGFRIPTQALSSIETFRIQGFLPEYMGHTVVVPSEITTKAGSDFDIDKLNMYLKSIYIDNNGEIKLAKLIGDENTTKEFYRNIFNKTLENRIDNNLKTIEGAEFIKSVVNNLNEDDGFLEELKQEQEKLSNESFQSLLREKYADGMYKKSLENEYYNTLEKLVTLPEVFNRLITPIGDGGLKKLSETINDLRGKNEGIIKNKILNRNYLTDLRHSFLMGKKWVGIVAVNITNLSLKQKSQVYIDIDRATLSESDKKILGDGSIILKHNTTNVNGKEYISLSGTTVRDSKEFISDRLSGYATAVVDIVKDNYISDIIQSDLVMSTAMFLENIGAGEQGVLFLNQPIISEYLQLLDSISSKTLFNEDNINKVKNKFIASKEQIEKAVIDISMLVGNIHDYYEKGYFKLSDDNAVQHKILDEFLKYAKMAEYNFEFTQATNYDTSSFRSAETLTRKQLKTKIAQRNNIISSVNNILDNTYIGKQVTLLTNSVEALGTVLKLDQPKFKQYTDAVLQPYAENKFLNNDKFEKIAVETKSAFIDYVIQTNSNITDRLEELLINPETSVVTRIEKAKQEFPKLQILQEFQVITANREGGASSIKLVVKPSIGIEEDMYVDFMRELRDFPQTNQLYKDIVTLSIIQGTYSSAISIRNIIPLEDYANIVEPIISSLQVTLLLDGFKEGMFQRNNFRNNDVVKEVAVYVGEDYNAAQQGILSYSSPAFTNVEALGVKSIDRKILTLQKDFNENNEFVKVKRLQDIKGVGKYDLLTGKTVTKFEFKQRMEKGDNSLFDVLGYKRVKYISGEPLITSKDIKKVPTDFYVYKQINLYGDGDKATENYDVIKKSIFNNGTVKVENELLDGDIIEAFKGNQTEEIVSSLEIQNNVENKYELFPNVFANQGQKEAIDLLMDFLNSKEEIFTLNGRGGTGKTTIIKKILGYTKSNIGGITIAHKAKKVLGKSIGKEKVKTVASALAIKLDETTGFFTPDQFAREKGRVPIRRMDIIIVDEASMISPSIYEEILSLKNPSAKVIFMGDNAQLPPIGEEIDSPVFDVKNQYTLIEKMRQAKTSPIINIGSIIADNIEAYNTKLVALSTADRISNYDKVSNSETIFTNNEENAINDIVEDLKKNKGANFVKAVTFNNERHSAPQSVKNLNNKIRLKLYGKESKNQFNIGELLTAYDTYSKDIGADDDQIPIHNSDDLIVTGIEIRNNEEGYINAYSNKTGTRTYKWNYDIIYLALNDEDGRQIVGYSVPVIAESSKSKFEKDLADLWKTDKQMAFTLKGNFANLQYGYAITSHKAQGSTYTNTYVFEDNILGQTNASSVEAKNKSLYVAVSRPTTKLVMISSRNNEYVKPFNDNLNNFNSLKEFNSERKQEILSNFATKHKMTIEEAENYINKALIDSREEVINKLKDCY